MPAPRGPGILPGASKELRPSQSRVCPPMQWVLLILVEDVVGILKIPPVGEVESEFGGEFGQADGFRGGSHGDRSSRLNRASRRSKNRAACSPAFRKPSFPARFRNRLCPRSAAPRMMRRDMRNVARWEALTAGGSGLRWFFHRFFYGAASSVKAGEEPQQSKACGA